MVLQSQPTHVAALNLLSVVLSQLGRCAEAEAYIQAALKLNSKSDATFYNYGLILKALKRPDEALERFSQALSINSAVAETWNNRGTIQNDLGRYDAAIVDFDKALELQPNYSDAFCNKGKSLTQLRQHDAAMAAYDTALALKPDLAEAWLGRGNAFTALKRYNEAFAAYDKALSLGPDLAEAWLGQANAFSDLKHHDEAFAAYDKALLSKPDLAEAWLGRGNTFTILKRHDEAFAAYDKAMLLKPDLTGLEGYRLHAKMHLGDWRNFNVECTHLISSVRNGKLNSQPFQYIAVPSSPKDQLQCARLAVSSSLSHKPIWQGERYDHDRIHVAYISADFREHPVSFLIAGMTECHDRSRFETTGISLGPPDNSEIRQRLEGSFDHFIDASAFSDDQVADCIRSSEVDILIDLMGFTADSRGPQVLRVGLRQSR